jgi:hypothetical protein
MPSLDTELLQPLIKLYIHLGGGVLLGWVLGRCLPKTVPVFIGQFLFWIGVPVSIITFLRRADLSGAIWIAPVVAWVAILLGAGLAWAWMQGRWRTLPEKPGALRTKSRVVSGQETHSNRTTPRIGANRHKAVSCWRLWWGIRATWVFLSP